MQSIMTRTRLYPTQWDLSGKTVLITGASRGVGQATALSYARAGASGIVIAARSSKALEELASEIRKIAKAGNPAPKVLSLDCDVTDEKSVERAAESVQEMFGSLDVLVNNAGALEPFVPIAESKPDVWWNTWVVNMRGMYLVTRAFLPLILKSNGKTIVNVSSNSAHWLVEEGSSYQVGISACACCKFLGHSNDGHCDNQTTKLAILRFSEFLELEYGPLGVLPIGKRNVLRSKIELIL